MNQDEGKLFYSGQSGVAGDRPLVVSAVPKAQTDGANAEVRLRVWDESDANVGFAAASVQYDSSSGEYIRINSATLIVPPRGRWEVEINELNPTVDVSGNVYEI